MLGDRKKMLDCIYVITTKNLNTEGYALASYNGWHFPMITVVYLVMRYNYLGVYIKDIHIN